MAEGIRLESPLDVRATTSMIPAAMKQDIQPISGPELAELRRLRLGLSEPPDFIAGYAPGEFERRWKADEDRERELAGRPGAPSWLPGQTAHIVSGIGAIALFVGLWATLALVGISIFAAAIAGGSDFNTPSSSPRIVSEATWVMGFTLEAAFVGVGMTVAGLAACLGGTGLYSHWRRNQERLISEWEHSPEALAYNRQLQEERAARDRKWDLEVKKAFGYLRNGGVVDQGSNRAPDHQLPPSHPPQTKEQDSDDLELF